MLACASTASAFAQEASPLGWYAGVSAGRSKATIDDYRITQGLLGSGFASTSIVDDNHDTAFKVLGGYQFNNNFAVEAGYFNLGDFSYVATTNPPGTLTGRAKVQGINLDLVGRLPLTERFSVLGRVGANYADTRDTFQGTGAVVVTTPTARERATNLKYGVGMEYAFTPALSARAEVERYRIRDAVGNRGHIDTAMIGLVYRFGGPDVTPVRAAYVAPAPAPVIVPVVVEVAPTPAPAPVPVAQKVTFGADTLFAFDKSVLTPAGRQILDEVIAKQQGMTLEVIVATGHTDSIGTDAYNQRLSERRAAAVKAYLFSKGIAAAQIFTEGKGEKQPIATNATAEGRAQNRRVDLEVVGTRNK